MSTSREPFIITIWEEKRESLRLAGLFSTLVVVVGVPCCCFLKVLSFWFDIEMAVCLLPSSARWMMINRCPSEATNHQNGLRVRMMARVCDERFWDYFLGMFTRFSSRIYFLKSSYNMLFIFLWHYWCEIGYFNWIYCSQIQIKTHVLIGMMMF